MRQGPFSTTFLDPMNVAQARGAQAKSPFDEAFKTIERMRQKDVTNLPERPEPVDNPFKNPLVMIGMSMQGKSADAIAMGNQIERVNQQRMDRYNEQVLNAHNYEQLRKSRLAMRLADLKVAGAREQQDAVEAALNRYQSDKQFAAAQQAQSERDAAIQARHDEDAELARRRLELAEKQFEISNNQLLEGAQMHRDLLKTDPQYAVLSRKRDALAAGEMVEQVKNEAGQDVLVQRSFATMDPEERESALNDLQAELLAGIRGRFTGLDKYVEAQTELINDLIEVHRGITPDETAQMRPPLAPPAGEMEGPQNLSIEEQRARLATGAQFRNVRARPAPDVNPRNARSVINFFEEFSEFLSPAESLEFEKFRDERNKMGFLERLSDLEGIGNLPVSQKQAYLRRFKHNIADKGMQHLQTKEGKSDFVTIAREVAQEASAEVLARRVGEPGPLNAQRRKALYDEVRRRVAQATGVRIGYLSEDNKWVTRAIEQGLREAVMRGGYSEPSGAAD